MTYTVCGMPHGAHGEAYWSSLYITENKDGALIAFRAWVETETRKPRPAFDYDGFCIKENAHEKDALGGINLTRRYSGQTLLEWGCYSGKTRGTWVDDYRQVSPLFADAGGEG